MSNHDNIALQLADRLDAVPETGADPELIEQAAAELRRLHQVDVAHGWWIDKTEWVQESSEASDLGQHLADIMKQRIDRLHAENEALRKAVSKLHAAKGRYHTQLAACDLYDLCNLKNERPTK